MNENENEKKPVTILFPKTRRKNTRTFMFACPKCSFEYETEVFSQLDYDIVRVICLGHFMRHEEMTDPAAEVACRESFTRTICDLLLGSD